MTAFQTGIHFLDLTDLNRNMLKTNSDPSHPCLGHHPVSLRDTLLWCSSNGLHSTVKISNRLFGFTWIGSIHQINGLGNIPTKMSTMRLDVFVNSSCKDCLGKRCFEISKYQGFLALLQRNGEIFYGLTARHVGAIDGFAVQNQMGDRWVRNACSIHRTHAELLQTSCVCKAQHLGIIRPSG